MTRSEKFSAAMRRRLDPLVKTMYAEYNEGRTMAEVGALHGRTQHTVFNLFKNRGLPTRGQKHLPASYAQTAQKRRSHLDALVAQMHADYMRPMSISALARKYGGDRRRFAGLFKARGLCYRAPTARPPARLANGRIAAYVPLTAAQLDECVAAATRLVVPEPLRFEWRKWSMARRRVFVRRLREQLALPDQMPATRLSAGLEAFEYGHPRAHAIAARANRGCGSHPACSIKISSQGVIWRDQLWFWSQKNGYERGPWTKEGGRPLLHHVIFQQAHGPIPAHHVVRFLDGNTNNLDPRNLALETRAQMARLNRATGRGRASRELTAILLNRHQNKSTNDHIHHFRGLRKGSRHAV